MLPQAPQERRLECVKAQLSPVEEEAAGNPAVATPSPESTLCFPGEERSQTCEMASRVTGASRRAGRERASSVW